MQGFSLACLGVGALAPAKSQELFGVADKFKGRGRPKKSLVPEK